jgi:hypothetical protein
MDKKFKSNNLLCVFKALDSPPFGRDFLPPEAFGNDIAELR